MAVNPTDICSGSTDLNIPQWKKDLIIRRRTRVLQVGTNNATFKLTCPAVVSNLRDPEISSGFDSADKFQRLESSGDEEDRAARNSISLNQEGQDFPSSTLSCSGDSSIGSSMRSLDLDVCNEVKKIAINGPDLNRKKSEVPGNNAGVNNNSIMVVDTIKHKHKNDKNNRSSPMTRRRPNTYLKQTESDNKESKFAPKQNGTCFPGKDEDCLSDSSEELKYGPGIVNKLKTKYMSMTLREQKRNARPSIMNLRRAASLENMLEGDVNSSEQCFSESERKYKTELTATNYKIGHIKKSACVGFNSNHRVMRQVEYKGRDKMKRTRSMDTLLKPELLHSNTKFQENNRSILSSYDLKSDQIVFPPFVNENVIIVEHSTSVNNHQSKSAPKPEDLVAAPSSIELPPPDVVKQTLKIFENSHPKKLKLNHQYNSARTMELSRTNRTTPGSNSFPDKSKLSSTKPALSPKPSPEKIRQNRSRLVGSPKKCHNSNAFGDFNNSTNSPSSSSASDDKNNKINDHRPFTEQQACNLNNFDDFDKTDSNESCKPVLQSALENIRKGGTSMHYSFRNDLSSDLSKSHLPRQNNTAQALNTSLLHQKYPLSPVSIVAPLRTHNSPQTKQIGIIRPLVSTVNQTSNPSAPTLTEQEIEKNLINRVKSIEHPINKVVVAIKGLPDNVVIGTVTSDVMSNPDLSMVRVCQSSKIKSQGLWDEKQLWQQNQNTIVFNFSDRKEVPDYIENDGIILKAKGDWSRPRSDQDVENGDNDDDLGSGVGRPPSPCHVTFEGDNVVINGKSNLRKSPGRAKMRIKFDDEATTTFEYPSEASLSCETDSGAEGESGKPHPAGGDLGAYAPRKTDAGAGWQLGVAPVARPPAHAQAHAQPETEPDPEHLVPASEEETHAWSEAVASDLLF